MRALKTKMVFLTAHIDGHTDVRNENRNVKMRNRILMLFDENAIVMCKQYKDNEFHSHVFGVKLASEDDIELLTTMAFNFSQTKVLYCDNEGVGRRYTMREDDEDTSRLLGPCVVDREEPVFATDYIFISDNPYSAIGTYFYFDKHSLRNYRYKLKKQQEHKATFEEM